MRKAVIMWKLLFIIICIVQCGFLNYRADYIPSGNSYTSELNEKNSDSPKTIFQKIEEGIAFGEIEKFSGSLSSQTYLSLSNGVTGYYSPNQAFYILQDYFNIYRPVSFRYLNMNDQTDNPYASGYFKFESRGVRGTAQVYIALKLMGNNWKISQITIN